MLGNNDLEPILAPRSIAVIGASRDPGKVGHAIFRNILEYFQGTVYPVNPKASSIAGILAYPSILEIPRPIDLAVLIVPAQAVPSALEECGRKGVKGVVVISAGFREMGEEGKRREEEVKKAVARWGFSLLGPNCLGVINTAPQVRLNATFARHMPRAGNIAFLSQSGALASAVLDYARGKGIGFSKLVSLGNKADITELELLAALRDDPQTEVILLYLEELSDGRRFIELCREITGEIPHPKPVLAVKAGRTPAGARAVSSHTGALAGSDEVYDAIFQQAGVLRVESVEELFHYAEAFAHQPLPLGPRVAIVTNAGGPGIMAADACARQGLELASLREETKKRLRAALPQEAAVDNPVDLIGDAQHDRYQLALTQVLADPTTDAAIVLLTPQAVTDVEQIARTILSVSPEFPKPVLACFMGVVDVSAGVEILQESGIPHYSFPEEAVRALAAMVRYAGWVHRPRTEFRKFPIDRERVQKIISQAPRGEFVSETLAFELLDAYGLTLQPWAAAVSLEEAVARAEEIGYPVALKVLSSEIVHKVEVGGVRLNLRTADELREAYAAMLAEVKIHHPQTRVEEVMVQKMAGKGVETILGIKRDPQFGPILMFGLGGTYVEVLRDVTFRLAPVRELGAWLMVETIKAAKILQGFRGQPPSDIEAIEECIERLSQLAVEVPEIEELDINPLLVYPVGQGAVVLDARLRLSASQKKEEK